jgi:hypothetical protein
MSETTKAHLDTAIAAHLRDVNKVGGELVDWSLTMTAKLTVGGQSEETVFFEHA